MVVEAPTETVDRCLEHEHQTSDLSVLPGVDIDAEKGVAVDVVHLRCAGIDSSKRDAKVCVRIVGEGRARATSTVMTWSATTNQVLALRDHLIGEQVSSVVMEATSDSWKPFSHLLEDGPFPVMLVKVRHVKNLPGRKTDVSDAQWLAELGAHGLVRGSFVPPAQIPQLRDLTRTRTTGRSGSRRCRPREAAAAISRPSIGASPRVADR
jgi:hypothetical protein